MGINSPINHRKQLSSKKVLKFHIFLHFKEKKFTFEIFQCFIYLLNNKMPFHDSK